MVFTFVCVEKYISPPPPGTPQEEFCGMGPHHRHNDNAAPCQRQLLVECVDPRGTPREGHVLAPRGGPLRTEEDRRRVPLLPSNLLSCHHDSATKSLDWKSLWWTDGKADPGFSPRSSAWLAESLETPHFRVIFKRHALTASVLGDPLLRLGPAVELLHRGEGSWLGL